MGLCWKVHILNKHRMHTQFHAYYGLPRGEIQWTSYFRGQYVFHSYFKDIHILIREVYTVTHSKEYHEHNCLHTHTPRTLNRETKVLSGPWMSHAALVPFFAAGATTGRRGDEEPSYPSPGWLPHCSWDLCASDVARPCRISLLCGIVVGAGWRTRCQAPDLPPSLDDIEGKKQICHPSSAHPA
jgi:hypothetical protein